MINRKKNLLGSFWKLEGPKTPIGFTKDSCCIRVKKIRRKRVLELKDIHIISINRKENFHSIRITTKNSNQMHRMRKINHSKMNR
jgi:hypothetical protein